ncbi:FHA domain-containing protein [Sandaracinus amylolyticus]|uniref:FHA domain-containing protein n=1 Tax=Sandaracinus amylolyticus TaxID=927083 RepID=UPI00069E2197|nr:FHA domain-containing protein [Sandaracinus amylolyticus]
MDRAGAIALVLRVIVVGRARDCDVVIDDPTVSAHHARLRWDGDRIAIDDLGSANGTFVDGRMVSATRIRPGEEVVLGRVPLPWAAEKMRAFLRAGPRRTTLRSSTLRGRPLWGRRFVCGACGTRGLLPPGFDRGELVCSACGAHLVLGEDRGDPPRVRAALVGAGAVLTLVLAGIMVAASPARAEHAWSRLGAWLGLVNEPTPTAASSPEEASIRARVAPLVAASIDAGHPRTRNLAVRIAASAGGPFHVEQVARVWSHVRREWRYVSDPRGGEYFATASETIENGLAGDCDDFATVMIAMLQAIGGQARMVMVDGDGGGHAYAEVCVDASAEDVARRLAAFYRSPDAPERVELGDIHYRSDGACPVWLNLDWNARAPGGHYGRERWAVAIHPDGHTETLAPAAGDGAIGVVPEEVRASAAPE